jgi:hypothetical protein
MMLFHVIKFPIEEEVGVVNISYNMSCIPVLNCCSGSCKVPLSGTMFKRDTVTKLIDFCVFHGDSVAAV